MIAIKDMKMPSCCSKCDFLREELDTQDWCLLACKSVYHCDKKLDDCPLIEIDEKWKAISLLSELRSNYDCFDKKEELYYHALSLAIKSIKKEIESEEK